MKLTIFGATGRTGRHLVLQALNAGYDVIAFVRNQNRITITHKNLVVVQGDATDQTAVELAVCGTDAVISLMTTSSSQKIAASKPLARGIKNIIDAMEKYGVRRLIMSTGSIPQTEDLCDIRFNLLMIIGKLIVRSSYEDSINAVKVVQSSNVDWTLIRMAPTDAPPTGQVNAGYVNKETKMFVSRPDAAMFILKEVTERKFIREVPAIYSLQHK